ncbi:MAG: T9SS type A sorting domain-containing protein [Bacteroidetes bacterium]|nr:T9SS type A sorting domain-containing protein [Bacteroidota bacterium]
MQNVSREFNYKYYVNALTGNVVDSISNSHGGLGTAICRSPYNCQQYIDTDWRGGIFMDYYLRAHTSSRLFETRTHFPRLGWEGSGKITDADNDWQTDHQYKTTAHFHMQNAWDYFSAYPRYWRGPDNKSKEILVWVAQTDNVQKGIKMEFADNKHKRWLLMVGKSGTDFYGTVDLIGHEYSHSFMIESVGLVRQGQSGWIHEGLGDAFGVCVEHYVDGGNPDWSIGNDENLQVRNVSAPWQSLNANDYSEIDYSKNDYYNGAIAGRWFFILSDGEPYGNTPWVSGIGIDKAERIIFRMFESGFVTSNAGYNQIASASVNAASQLYGVCSWEVTQTILAWNKVLIYPKGNCTTASISSILTKSFGIEIYPNPSNSKFRINLSGTPDKYLVTVFDITGREVLNPISMVDKTIIIDVSGLASGTYMCQVKNSNGEFVTKKVIVTH